MPLPPNFIQSLEPIPASEVFERLREQVHTRRPSTLELTNEVRPVDLFCYLGARFGPPNGIQTLLRSDDSDNLVQWDWTLRHPHGLVTFMGLNFRTELHVFGLDVDRHDGSSLVQQLKADFGNHGAGMKGVRQRLEHWTEFVNPYQRIKRAVERLVSSLETLELHPQRDRLEPFQTSPQDPDVAQRWIAIAERYSQGFGLCFGIRSMLPVMAEAFVNLLLYILMRPELRGDERLRDNAFRQPIDVRVKSLSMTCVGFKQQPDYSHEACRAYHRLVNERNDLLHGNVVIDKLKFNEVYFLGTIPVFKEYRTAWERSLQIEANAVGLESLQNELNVVRSFTEYLLSCLDDGAREQVSMIVERHELALNDSGRIGILFPEWLVDFRAGGVLSDDTPSPPAEGAAADPG